MQQLVSVEARALNVPMKKPFGIAGGAQKHALNVVATVGAAGMHGLGEGAPFPAFNGETQQQVLDSLTRISWSGVDIDDNAAIRDRLRDATPSARCAVESAIVDCRARLAGIPLYRLFGTADELDLITDITITTGSVDDAAREATQFAAFSTLKIKVGGGNVDDDIARVRAVRRVRPDARILVDANAGYALADALAFARGVGEADIALFEQPVRDWDALVEVRSKTGLRVAIDESVTCADDVSTAKRLGAADAVNIKIMKSGIFEALAIAERARAEGLTLMIGGMVETRLAMGISACIAGGLGGFSFIDLDTPLFLATDPWTGGYSQDGERLRLSPIDVGHGIVGS
jgi:L-alanine-DL-glutamate epimerase-like enolase superfamily enzyme